MPAIDIYGYGPRHSGKGNSAFKGRGWLGPLENSSGQVMSEYSIGVEIGGKEVEIPSIVPTLSYDEVQGILKTGEITDAIRKKALEHAMGRIRMGKSPFVDDDPAPENNSLWKISPVGLVRRK